VRRGAVLTIAQCWELSLAWYPGRMRADWRKPNAKETQAIFDSLGLRGEFWRVA
jgi:hypothetical protein